MIGNRGGIGADLCREGGNTV